VQSEKKLRRKHKKLPKDVNFGANIHICCFIIAYGILPEFSR